MGIYKNILVPVILDHQEKAEHAVKVAESLKAEDGKITLLHVMEEIPTYIASQLTSVVLEESRSATRTKLEDIANRLANGASAEIVEGHANRTILDYAEKMAADCIVIASHQPGFEDYLIGSTASRIVRHAKCPVHVLR